MKIVNIIFSNELTQHTLSNVALGTLYPYTYIFVGASPPLYYTYLNTLHCSGLNGHLQLYILVCDPFQVTPTVACSFSGLRSAVKHVFHVYGVRLLNFLTRFGIILD
jgi:hypothetical protein